MVTRKEEEIKEELSRSKSYSVDSEYLKAIENNYEGDSIGNPYFSCNEEITGFRYPAILLIGDTGE